MSFIPSEMNPDGQQDVWTPAVWSTSPDSLVNQARAALFSDSQHITHTVLNNSDVAMSGAQTAPQNETDQIIPPGQSSGGSRASNWESIMNEMRNTEPVVWSDSEVTEGVNPTV